MHSLYNGPSLRAWQEEAILVWKQHKNGIVQAVPGAGKTILAIRMLCEKLEENPKMKVLIVCPRLTLIQQWISAIAENSHIHKKEIYEVSSNTESKAYASVQEKLAHHRIFISTFHQIRQFFGEYKWKEHEWFLIVDEMHNTRENYKFPGDPIKYKLGLSATPKKRGRDADFNLGGIIYTYSFTQALADKIILDPVVKIVFYSVTKQLFKKIASERGFTADLVESAYDDFLPEEGAGDGQAMQGSVAQPTSAPSLDGAPPSKTSGFAGPVKAAAFTWSPNGVGDDVFTSKSTDFFGIARILEEQFGIGTKKSVQTLVFVNRIKKADLLNKMLALRFSEKVSHSYHSKSERYNLKNHFSELKQNFAEGRFNVLISVGTLGEGIDFPYASHGIIASPIYNPTSFVQKVGRLLRAYKDHKKAVIYYYVPSELMSRLLTDEKIEPNYFKSVLKIADQNGDLYFVDRESLEEEKGSLSDLLSQGSAYERNEDVRRIKVPHDLDAVLRFLKRVRPDAISSWKRFYSAASSQKPVKSRRKKKSKLGAQEKEQPAPQAAEFEPDFSPLREELARKSSIVRDAAADLCKNLELVLALQKEFSSKKFSDFASVKDFIRGALKRKIIVKIKFGHELEKVFSQEASLLSPSEQVMLRSMVLAELGDFCSKQKEMQKLLSALRSAQQELSLQATVKKQSKKTLAASRTKRLHAMARISKNFFDLQSAFLDELDLNELAGRDAEGGKIFLTIGKDIFVTRHLQRKYSYPEDFGLSRWLEEKEPPKKIVEYSSIEKFARGLMQAIGAQTHGHAVQIGDWPEFKKRLCAEQGISEPEDEAILRELEKHKFEKEFSFEKLFFVSEAIKRSRALAKSLSESPAGK